MAEALGEGRPAIVAAGDHIRLAVEEFGPPSTPAVLLIMGLGAQMVRWPVELCAALSAAGFRVIRFDNRDCGLSTHMTDAFVPDVMAALRSGQSGVVPYTLEDMAQDCAGLLDALDIPAAHIAGASMGGAIAQIFAARYPQRTLSLTSIMSSSGNPSLPPPTPAAAVSLMAPLPRQRDRDSIVTGGMLPTADVTPITAGAKTAHRVA